MDREEHGGFVEEYSILTQQHNEELLLYAFKCTIILFILLLNGWHFLNKSFYF